MTRNPKYIVIVTYQEWVIWTTCGALRIGKRRRTNLKEYEQTPSLEAFGELMDKAPDVSRWEDQAYLVAYLSSTPPGSTSGKFTDLQLVTSFHPLSTRGRALLKGDAKRALVKLGEPVYESRWREWVNANRAALQQTSARHLVEAFGLRTIDADAHLDLEMLLQPVSALLQGHDELEVKRLEKKLTQGRKFARQPAYGWWLALTVLKSHLRQDTVDAFTEEANLFFERSSLEMGSVDEFTRPVKSWEPAMKFAATKTQRFQHGSNTPLPVMAVIFHYQHAIEEFGMIDYQSLSEDLQFLRNGSDDRGIEIASLAAWCIGWHLDNATARALRCAAVPHEASAVIDLDQVPQIPVILEQQEMREQASGR